MASNCTATTADFVAHCREWMLESAQSTPSKIGQPSTVEAAHDRPDHLSPSGQRRLERIKRDVEASRGSAALAQLRARAVFAHRRTPKGALNQRFVDRFSSEDDSTRRSTVILPPATREANPQREDVAAAPSPTVSSSGESFSSSSSTSSFDIEGLRNRANARKSAILHQPQQQRQALVGTPTNNPIRIPSFSSPSSPFMLNNPKDHKEFVHKTAAVAVEACCEEEGEDCDTSVGTLSSRNPSVKSPLVRAPQERDEEIIGNSDIVDQIASAERVQMDTFVTRRSFLTPTKFPGWSPGLTSQPRAVSTTQRNWRNATVIVASRRPQICENQPRPRDGVSPSSSNGEELSGVSPSALQNHEGETAAVNDGESPLRSCSPPSTTIATDDLFPPPKHFDDSVVIMASSADEEVFDETNAWRKKQKSAITESWSINPLGPLAQQPHIKRDGTEEMDDETPDAHDENFNDETEVISRQPNTLDKPWLSSNIVFLRGKLKDAYEAIEFMRASWVSLRENDVSVDEVQRIEDEYNATMQDLHTLLHKEQRRAEKLLLLLDEEKLERSKYQERAEVIQAELRSELSTERAQLQRLDPLRTMRKDVATQSVEALAPVQPRGADAWGRMMRTASPSVSPASIARNPASCRTPQQQSASHDAETPLSPRIIATALTEASLAATQVLRYPSQSEQGPIPDLLRNIHRLLYADPNSGGRLKIPSVASSGTENSLENTISRGSVWWNVQQMAVLLQNTESAMAKPHSRVRPHVAPVTRTKHHQPKEDFPLDCFYAEAKQVMCDALLDVHAASSCLLRNFTPILNQGSVKAPLQLPTSSSSGAADLSILKLLSAVDTDEQHDRFSICASELADRGEAIRMLQLLHVSETVRRDAADECNARLHQLERASAERERLLLTVCHQHEETSFRARISTDWSNDCEEFLRLHCSIVAESKEKDLQAALLEAKGHLSSLQGEFGVALQVELLSMEERERFQIIDEESHEFAGYLLSLHYGCSALALRHRQRDALFDEAFTMKARLRDDATVESHQLWLTQAMRAATVAQLELNALQQRTKTAESSTNGLLSIVIEAGKFRQNLLLSTVSRNALNLDESSSRLNLIESEQTTFTELLRHAPSSMAWSQCRERLQTDESYDRARLLMDEHGDRCTALYDLLATQHTLQFLINPQPSTVETVSQQTLACTTTERSAATSPVSTNHPCESTDLAQREEQLKRDALWIEQGHNLAEKLAGMHSEMCLIASALHGNVKETSETNDALLDHIKQMQSKPCQREAQTSPLPMVSVSRSTSPACKDGSAEEGAVVLLRLMAIVEAEADHRNELQYEANSTLLLLLLMEQGCWNSKCDANELFTAPPPQLDQREAQTSPLPVFFVTRCTSPIFEERSTSDNDVTIEGLVELMAMRESEGVHRRAVQDEAMFEFVLLVHHWTTSQFRPCTTNELDVSTELEVLATRFEQWQRMDDEENQQDRSDVAETQLKHDAEETQSRWRERFELHSLQRLTFFENALAVRHECELEEAQLRSHFENDAGGWTAWSRSAVAVQTTARSEAEVASSTSTGACNTNDIAMQTCVGVATEDVATEALVLLKDASCDACREEVGDVSVSAALCCPCTIHTQEAKHLPLDPHQEEDEEEGSLMFMSSIASEVADMVFDEETTENDKLHRNLNKRTTEQSNQAWEMSEGAETQLTPRRPIVRSQNATNASVMRTPTALLDEDDAAIPHGAQQQQHLADDGAERYTPLDFAVGTDELGSEGDEEEQEAELTTAAIPLMSPPAPQPYPYASAGQEGTAQGGRAESRAKLRTICTEAMTQADLLDGACFNDEHNDLHDEVKRFRAFWERAQVAFKETLRCIRDENTALREQLELETSSHTEDRQNSTIGRLLNRTKDTDLVPRRTAPSPSPSPPPRRPPPSDSAPSSFAAHNPPGSRRTANNPTQAANVHRRFQKKKL